MVKFFTSLIVLGVLFSSITVFLFYIFILSIPDDQFLGGNCEYYEHCKDDLKLLPLTVEKKSKTEIL